MLRSASRALVVSAIETTRRVLGFIGGSAVARRYPVPSSGRSRSGPAAPFASADSLIELESQELQALSESLGFEDKLLSELVSRIRSIHFTPLQMMLLFIVCKASLKNVPGCSDEGGARGPVLSDEDGGVMRAFGDLIESELERTYHLASARNALVSPDSR